MGPLFSYSLVSSLLLVAMYVVYKWLMAGERQHACNRLALWLIYVTALILPAYIPSLRSLADTLFSSSVAVPSGGMEVGVPAVDFIDTAPALLPRIFLAVYTLGIAFSALFTIMVIVRLMRVISSGEKIDMGNYTLILTSRSDIAPFSWMRYIVMSREDYVASGSVITVHEMRHLALRHWIDLAFAQCVAIFQWYNPASWLMREELKAVHEYQADEAVMDSGADIRQYQMLLVKKAVGARFPSLANSLNHSKLKKRITMMYKSNSSVWRRMRSVALVPAVVAVVCATGIPAVASLLSDASSAAFASASDGKVSEKSSAVQLSAASGSKEKPAIYIDGVRQPAEFYIVSADRDKIKAMTIIKADADGGEDAVFIEMKGDHDEKSPEFAEKLPEFPGGMEAMMIWLSTNIAYPDQAYRDKQEGRVVVRFTVGADGVVRNPEIIKSASPLLDEEAGRVVQSMPAWTPGRNKSGEAVDCAYTLPIDFKLTSGSTKK